MGFGGTVDINKSLDGLGSRTLVLTPQAKLFETADSKGYEVTFQFSLVAQSYPTLFDPMDCSMPDLPVHHQLPELAQTQVH